MSYSVEKISGNQVKISFEVPAAEFDSAIQKAYLKLRGRINVPGFRKGKAPRKLIERMYGDGVFYEEALDIIFPDVYTEAVKGEDLNVVDQAQMDQVEQMAAGQDLKFSVKVYVSPDVEIGEYKGLKAVKYVRKVTDEDVDQAISQDAERATTRMEVTDRALKSGDIAKLDYAGTVDGVAFEGGTAKDQSLEIGSGSFIPGFEDQMIGMAVGEEKDLHVTFPEQYHAEELAGKEAVFHVRLLGIEEKVRPEMDDEFAKDVSEYQTFEEYKAAKRAGLEETAEKNADGELEQQLIQQAVDASDCDIPDAMIESRLDSMMRQYEMRLAYQGMRLNDFLKYTGQTEEQMRDMYRSEAHNQVKSSLVLKAIADKENVQVTDEDVDKLIGDDAKASGQKVEDYRARISDRDMEYYREDARTRKTIDLIKEAAKVEVKDADERIKAADAAKAVESVAAAAEALEESDPDKE
ncbi:MAG: trigger factor [Clostridia bacterium]|nr:trigger factor [Clostridia bacterium]